MIGTTLKNNFIIRKSASIKKDANIKKQSLSNVVVIVVKKKTILNQSQNPLNQSQNPLNQSLLNENQKNLVKYSMFKQTSTYTT